MGVLFLAVVVVLILLLNQGKGPGGLSFRLGGATNVTPGGYEMLRSGSTLQEVETVLGGAGRTPTAADFDAICGTEVERFTNPFFQQRPIFEENARRGTMRVWVSGNVRILLTFSQPADAGGQLVAKLLKGPDGSVLSESGGQFGPLTLPNMPNGWANAPAPQAGGDVDWNLFLGTWEVVGDPRFRYRFGMNGADKEIADIFCVDGRPARETVYKVQRVMQANGRVMPAVRVTVNGRELTMPTFGMFWFENGQLRREFGGQPVQTLRRVG